MFIVSLFHVVSLIAQPVLALCAWLILLSFLWSLCNTLLQGWAILQRLHKIPCSGCAFFTGEYYLKCTVHPCTALTEAAIDCLDHEPVFFRGRD